MRSRQWLAGALLVLGSIALAGIGDDAPVPVGAEDLLVSVSGLAEALHGYRLDIRIDTSVTEDESER